MKGQWMRRGVVLLVVGAVEATAGDLDLAPPTIALQESELVVPVDFSTLRTDLQFDLSNRRVLGRATATFEQREDGFPMMDMLPAPQTVEIDGQSVDPALFAELEVGQGMTKVRILRQPLAANEHHTLIVTYEMPQASYSIDRGMFLMGFWMNDLIETGRGFWEQYGLSNLEFDHFRHTLSVRITGVTRDQALFTNGAVTAGVEGNAWMIEFPDFFTTSSFYLHVADPMRVKVARGEVFDGVRSIPITSYAASESDATSGMNRIKAVVEENSRVFGPSIHDRFVAYITPTGGGMEHCGGTMSSLWALAHEVTHFWFARGVMPADGNAGWVDEATASWRDDGYPRVQPSLRAPVNMANFSPFRRHTHMLAYDEGALLLAELDSRMADRPIGGLRPVLRKLYNAFGGRSLTTPMFEQFLEQESGLDLGAIFRRYVYGASSEVEGAPVEGGDAYFAARSQRRHHHSHRHHPRPYSAEELVRYR